MSPPGSPLALLTVLTSSGQPIFTSRALQLSVVHSHEPETISTMLNMRLLEALLRTGAPLPSGQSSYFKASCFWVDSSPVPVSPWSQLCQQTLMKGRNLPRVALSRRVLLCLDVKEHTGHPLTGDWRSSMWWRAYRARLREQTSLKGDQGFGVSRLSPEKEYLAWCQG